MDVPAELNKTLSANIVNVQRMQDETVVKQILFLTNNLLFILDQNKEVDYKIAIILEYFEGMQNIDPAADNEVINYLSTLREASIKKQISEQSKQVLLQFFDPDQINPAMVTFWLQRTCNLQEIKCMDTLMLFLNKEQQQKVLNMNATFKDDPYLQLLKRCLPVSR